MKIYHVIIVVVSLFYIAGTTVNFKPFSVSFKTPLEAFGILFLLLSLVCFQVSSHKKGFSEGFESGVKKSIEIIKNCKIK